ncbi:MAG: LysR family transcriptional regulator [Peptostreptococcaceae bacterium]|jgi:DNA-binding transcriptional LysR family regulator|nr:LysR family transcriptional regulator [Peptostreptococcaceae bacterium]
MEFRQLEYFKMVAKTKNITKAAKLLHVSQPSITNSIKNLEANLGVELLDRTKKYIDLTAEGEVFLKRVEVILKNIDDAKQEMKDFNNLNRGKLNIGIPPMIGTFLFPRVFTEFKKLYPNISLNLSEEGSLLTREKIDNQELDVGIIILSICNDHLDIIPMIESEILVCLNKNHRLSNKEFICMDDLKKESVILLKEGFFHRKKIMQLYKERNIEPDILLSSNQLETIKSLVKQDVAVSFLLKEIVEEDDELVKIPLKQRVMVKIGVAWNKDRYLSNAARAFLDFCREYNIKYSI